MIFSILIATLLFCIGCLSSTIPLHRIPRHAQPEDHNAANALERRLAHTAPIQRLSIHNPNSRPTHSTSTAYDYASRREDILADLTKSLDLTPLRRQNDPDVNPAVSQASVNALAESGDPANATPSTSSATNTSAIPPTTAIPDSYAPYTPYAAGTNSTASTDTGGTTTKSSPKTKTKTKTKKSSSESKSKSKTKSKAKKSSKKNKNS